MLYSLELITTCFTGEAVEVAMEVIDVETTSEKVVVLDQIGIITVEIVRAHTELAAEHFMYF